MAGSVGSVLPLWRIHNFSCAGSSVSIVNIGRPDTIALLRHLSRDGDPLSTGGRLTLAVDYAADLSCLREATLVRIKNVTVGSKPGWYSAELEVLCRARVRSVSTAGSFPRAERAPDLAPLWRIHNLGEDSSVSATPATITNIARDDTVALLKKLGDGDVKRAKGHIVLACDYKKTLAPNMRTKLARIGEVRYLEAEGRPPYGCSLTYLGYALCAAVEQSGAFPECLLHEMPIWRIHNLNQGSGETHEITNIARPDSVALLTHLGSGNPLNATGALVIGCDYKSPPSAGESARLMRITRVAAASAAGKFEAVLVDVDTICVGHVRSDDGIASWWPRVTVELPKIWRRTTADCLTGIAALHLAALIPPSLLAPASPRPAKDCHYWKRCEEALVKLLCDSGFDVDLNQYRKKDVDRCFCDTCHRLRGDRMVYTRGGEKYILPVGFARIGLVPWKTPAIVKVGFEKWHVCYHGTRYNYIADLLKTGQLLSPGSTTHKGDTIKIREGHYNQPRERTNAHTGRSETFDPRDKLFFSPAIKYCDYGDVYMNSYYKAGRHYRVALQLRLQPDTYEIGQQTVLDAAPCAATDIDPHVPNSCIEWYTKEIQTHFFVGILIRER